MLRWFLSDPTTSSTRCTFRCFLFAVLCAGPTSSKLEIHGSTDVLQSDVGRFPGVHVCIVYIYSDNERTFTVETEIVYMAVPEWCLWLWKCKLHESLAVVAVLCVWFAWWCAKRLFDVANIQYTDFIRTTETRHKHAVHHFWVGYVYFLWLASHLHSALLWSVRWHCFHAPWRTRSLENIPGLELHKPSLWRLLEFWTWLW